MVFVTGASFFTGTLLPIMCVLTACGCFLVGINLMSRGFVQASVRSDSFFTRGFNAKNRFGGAFYGLFHSALAQSSDVTAVTLVRLADIGTITLFQACACIIGANIGTTVTTFIVAGGLNLANYLSFLAFVGAIPLLSKKRGLKTFGEIVAGFGILFIGLTLMKTSTENEDFRALLNALFSVTESPLLLLAIAAGLTMIVQSSSVVTSMVVFLVSGGLLPIESALCLVVGANIGTCFTSWIASFGSSKTARQTAMFHTLFNLVGATMFIVVIYTPLNEMFFDAVAAMDGVSAEIKVALFHLLFNMIAALVMIPLLRPSVWLCKKIVRH